MFSHNSKARKILNVLDIIFCLISGYLYMWLATFGEEINMEELWILTGIMEIFFLISMYSNFMTDYLPEGSSEPVRDLQKIAIRYLKGDFFMQFLALIPFTFFIEIDRVFVHLYLLKVSRAFNAIKFFDVQKIFNNIKMIVRN